MGRRRKEQETEIHVAIPLDKSELLSSCESPSQGGDINQEEVRKKYYVLLSAIPLMLLPWVINEFPDHLSSLTFPLHFSLTLKFLNKRQFYTCPEHSFLNTTATRIYMVALLFNLTLFSFSSISDGAILSFQILCWFLLLEVIIIDPLYLNQLLLILWIFGSIFSAAFSEEAPALILKKCPWIFVIASAAFIVRIAMSCCEGLIQSNSILVCPFFGGENSIEYFVGWAILVVNIVLILV